MECDELHGSDGHDLLAFSEHNASADRTILLIHGAFGDRHDWDNVVSHLAKRYHVLVPDLPGHGEEFHNMPLSVPRASRMLRDLIAARARNRTAHIIGLSLGANIGAYLLAKHPEIASDSLLSGFGIHARTPAMASALPYGLWVSSRVEYAAPRPLLGWLMEGEALPRQDLSKVTLPLIRQVFGVDPDSEPYERWPEPWPARTLVIAAGKRSFMLPTNDNAEQARRLADIGRTLNSKTEVVTNMSIRHPWSIQQPALFAETVISWLDERALPQGFVSL